MNLGDLFLNPERLWWWVLIPLLVALYVWITRRKKRTGMRLSLIHI